MDEAEAKARARALRLDAQKHAVALASAVAHEVNNPVAFLSLASGELRRMAEGGASGKVDLARLAELGREIEESAARVGRIVHELRLFTRASEPSKSNTVDLARLVDGALTLAAGQLGQRARIEVAQVDAAAEVPAGLAYALLNVFLYIGESLAQAARNGERTVVRIEAHGGDATSVRLEVRGDPTWHEPPALPAASFSLELAADLLRAAHGTLTVTPSAETVIYELRIGEAPASDLAATGDYGDEMADDDRITERDLLAGSAEDGRLSYPPARPRVLIVDDETGLARALGRRLAALYDVDTAATAAEAMRRFDEHVYAAVVCDLHMPDQPGTTLHAALAQRSSELAARFIFTTGTDPAGDETHALALATGCAVLEKPFEGSLLEAAVERVVHRIR
jgi:CheY-like chemotaxis protein